MNNKIFTLFTYTGLLIFVSSYFNLTTLFCSNKMGCMSLNSYLFSLSLIFIPVAFLNLFLLIRKINPRSKIIKFTNLYILLYVTLVIISPKESYDFVPVYYETVALALTSVYSFIIFAWLLLNEKERRQKI